MSKLRFQNLDWLIVGYLLAAAAVAILISPAERTLGQGIKFVYLHVALTWVGMTGLLLSGLLGLGVAISGSQRLFSWGQTVCWVSTGLFALGFGISLLAAWINWGGIFWAEPRARAALTTLIIALVVMIAGNWLPWVRIKGLFYTALAIFLIWSPSGAPLVLHPRSPILTSSSLSIQITFLRLFTLGCLWAAWLVHYLHAREPRSAV